MAMAEETEQTRLAEENRLAQEALMVRITDDKETR